MLAGVLYQRPYYNWDIFPYMALTASHSEESIDGLHARVYREASSEMPADDFTAVAARQPECQRDPNRFGSMLPYYQIKPGYLLMTRFFHSVGFSLVAATYMPSIISFFLITCLLGWWLHRILPNQFVYPITWVISLMPFLLMTARYSSPDMPCALLLMAGLYLSTTGPHLAGPLLLLLAIPVRPDAVVFVIPILIALVLSHQIKPRQALLLGIAALTTTIWTLDGLSRVPEYFFTAQPWSANWTIPEAFIVYLSGLRHGLPSFINSSAMQFIFLAVVTLGIQLQQGNKILNNLWAQLTLASLISMLLRYGLHPWVEDRFLIPVYLTILISFVYSLTSVAGLKSKQLSS